MPKHAGFQWLQAVSVSSENFLKGCLAVALRGLDSDLGAADEIAAVTLGCLLSGVIGGEADGEATTSLGPAICRLVGVAAALAVGKVLSTRDAVADDEVFGCSYSHLFSPFEIRGFLSPWLMNKVYPRVPVMQMRLMK